MAALGPGAVAELLRLASAAKNGGEVRLPRYLPHLLRADLVAIVDGTLAVADPIPLVPPAMRWRFSPAVAADHAKWLEDRLSGA